MSNFELSVLFFLQYAVILATCRIVCVLVRYVGQPPVVSEMIAGVLLGPSLLGLLAPSGYNWLFPAPSRTVIYAVAQVGLALYMFLVGVEFRIDLISRRARSAAAVSLAGIAAPFALGALIALLTCKDKSLFAPSISAGQAVLYMGAAMSITAFPMLARIISERGLAGTSLGTLALAAGSLDDAAAWCVLAIVLASFKADPLIAVWAVGGGVAYVLFVLGVLRLLMRPLGAHVERVGRMTPNVLGLVLTMVMIGSWFTDRIGIYAVFGAFIMGAAMPRGKFAEELQRLVLPLTVNFLLPLFFVYSGLNTRIGLVDSPRLWLLAGVILAAACLGKGGACYAAARLCGEPPRQAAAIGALMNSRGLMELIILNIGYERGLITQTLFSIMVLMAVVTTLMATPAFELALGRRAEAIPPATDPEPA